MSAGEFFGDKLHQAAEVSHRVRSTPSEVDFAKRIREKGFRSATLTQCNSISSFLKLLYQYHLNPDEDFQVHLMTHEGAIGAVMAGKYLGAGEYSVGIFQNSGLSNFADAAVSFAENYEIPMLAITTFRGLGETSLPHQSWARRTVGMARLLMGGKHVYGSALGRHIEESFEKASDVVINEDEPGQAILLLPKWAIKETLPKSPPNKVDNNYYPLDPEIKAKKGTMQEDDLEIEEVSRDEALYEITRRHPDALVIACNGNTARALMRVKDRPNHFYNAAYMGSGKAIGWGAAMSNPGLGVVVIDGDENAQMGGHMYDVLHEEYPENLTIYTLNDGGASSVNASIPSRRLGYWHYDMTHVIKTRVEGITTHPRVEESVDGLFDPKDAEILKQELGELKYITRRVIRWREQEGKDPIKVPQVFTRG